MEKNLGHATAYGYAKSKGYSGTEEEFAELMADYATVGQSAAQSAEQAAASATSASGSAATASQAAQTATSKASEAVTAAGTATTKASEASTSADTASAAALSASTSAQTATTAASTATTKASEAAASEAAALSAKTDAESARDAAAQSASAAAESARTLTIDVTLTQSGQAADAKVVGDEIENITSNTENLFNSKWLLEASGWTKQDEVYTGTVRSLVDAYKRSVQPFPFTEFESGAQYTASLYAKLSGSETASDGFRLFVTYTDNTTQSIILVPNTTRDFTKFIGTTAAGKTVSAVNVSYGQGIDNTLYLKEFQWEKGTTPTEYIPFTIACDLTARGMASDISDTFNTFIEDTFTNTRLYKSITITQTDGKYINANGVISDSASYSVITADAIPGKTYKGYSYAYANNYYYAFYDSSDHFLSGMKRTDSGSGSIDFEAIAPSNAAKIAVEIHTTAITPSNSKIYESNDVYIINDDNVKKKWFGKKWVVVGDSLTAENSRTTVHYFDYVAEATGIAVVNMGASGTGYARGADSSAAFYQRILRCPTDADVVTIFGSFNDLGAELPLGSIDDTGTTTLAGCINTTISNLQSIIPLVNLGIVAPTPWATVRPSTSGSGYDYVEMLKSICERRSIPFLDLWRCSNLRPWDADFRPLAYSKDDGNGTHPDENGHKLIAPRFDGFLETLLM